MKVSYWRLSQFYFFYFASLGILVPFWSLYLDNLKFSALEIGQLVSTLAISKIIAPYLWGWVADQTGYHIRIVQVTSALCIFCFAPLLWLDTFWAILFFMFLFSFFWNASLPQFEVVTLAQLGKDKNRYSQIRLWGSLGFITTVVILGALFEMISIEWLPALLISVFVLIWISSLPVKEFLQQERTDSHIWSVIKIPQVLALLLSCFFMQASHGPYYTFYSIFMEGLDYSRLSIGLFWSLGVLAEVVLFLFMFRLLKVRPASYWLATACLLTSIRWVMMAWFSDVLWMVILTQCLHAASFGMFHAAAIHLIHDFFPQHQGRGQALYASVSFGAGGAVGSLYAGSLWESFSPAMTFMVAALVALVSFTVSLWVKNHPAESNG
jgi:PPP family 3-phenylpropionic acid transporter